MTSTKAAAVNNSNSPNDTPTPAPMATLFLSGFAVTVVVTLALWSNVVVALNVSPLFRSYIICPGSKVNGFWPLFWVEMPHVSLTTLYEFVQHHRP